MECIGLLQGLIEPFKAPAFVPKFGPCIDTLFGCRREQKAVDGTRATKDTTLRELKFLVAEFFLVSVSPLPLHRYNKRICVGVNTYLGNGTKGPVKG